MAGLLNCQGLTVDALSSLLHPKAGVLDRVVDEASAPTSYSQQWE